MFIAKSLVSRKREKNIFYLNTSLNTLNAKVPLEYVENCSIMVLAIKRWIFGGGWMICHLSNI